MKIKSRRKGNRQPWHGLPFWTTDCVPHGVFQQDTASAFLTSICSLFSCLILGTVRHKLGCDTTTPPKISSAASHTTGSFGAASGEVEQIIPRLFCVPDRQKVLKRKKKKEKQLLWRWFQIKAVPANAPLNLLLNHVTIPDDLGHEGSSAYSFLIKKKDQTFANPEDRCSPNQ